MTTQRGAELDKITANIPARTVKGSFGNTIKYPARSVTFERLNTNTWRLIDEEMGNPVYGESDVISAIRGASNWDEIRRACFAMHGFHA